MKAGELIKQLQEAIEIHGDHDIACSEELRPWNGILVDYLAANDPDNNWDRGVIELGG